MTIEDDDIAAQQRANRPKRGRDSGARQSIGGGTRVRDWVLGIIGVLIAAGLCAVANNLWQVNLTIRDVLAENRVTKDTLSDHETRIRAGERFQSTWEGRNMRGGPELKEPRHD